MRPLFTEFSYGFGLASEIAELARSGLMSAPILPSLVDESQLGWDINFRFLGMSLFLQFKLGDFLTRRTAVQWSLYGHPYFRFEVYRRSHSPQHNLLVRLGKREPFTFYAAPIFHTDAEFNHHFLSRSLVGSTLFVPARLLPPLVDDLQHHISYDQTQTVWFTTQPVRIQGATRASSTLDTIVSNLTRTRGHGVIEFDLSKLRNLLRFLLELMDRDADVSLNRFLPSPPNTDSPSEIVRSIRLILRSVFGVEWIVVGRSV